MGGFQLRFHSLAPQSEWRFLREDTVPSRLNYANFRERRGPIVRKKAKRAVGTAWNSITCPRGSDPLRMLGGKKTSRERTCIRASTYAFTTPRQARKDNCLWMRTRPSRKIHPENALK